MLGLIISTLISTVAIGATPIPGPDAQVATPAALTGAAAKEANRLRVASPAPGDDLARYSELESKTPAKVQDFKGGDAVVYISTGAAIVIIVVLLIILL